MCEYFYGDITITLGPKKIEWLQLELSFMSTGFMWVGGLLVRLSPVQ